MFQLVGVSIVNWGEGTGEGGGGKRGSAYKSLIHCYIHMQIRLADSGGGGGRGGGGIALSQALLSRALIYCTG